MKILLKDDKEIEKAHKVYTHFTQDEMMNEVYEAREKFNKDYNSALADTEEKGLNKGIQEGIQQNQIEIAKKMKKENLDYGLIMKITGLKQEEIELL